MLLDPSILVLFCFAITCIIYGSVRSYSFHYSSSGKRKDIAEAVTAFKVRNVIIFVLAGCATLLLFFYFFDIIKYVLLVIVTAVSLMSVFFVGAPLVDYVFARFHWENKAINIDRVPPIHYSLITMVFICLLSIGLWIATGYWLVVNCLAWCIGVTQLSLIRLPSMKLAVVLLCAFLVYDVFWVFISPLIFGESVMVAVASKMPVSALPMTLSMPHVFNEHGISLLGLGDIVLPGLFICYTYAFDTALSSSLVPRSIDDEILETPKVGYFVVSLVGYTLGYITTLVSFVIMEKGQPALLYLVPFCVIPVVIAARFQNHLNVMWNGLPRIPLPDIEDQALLPVGPAAAAANNQSNNANSNNNDDFGEYHYPDSFSPNSRLSLSSEATVGITTEQVAAVGGNVDVSKNVE